MLLSEKIVHAFNEQVGHELSNSNQYLAIANYFESEALFGLATLVGVPLGILCGCFTRVNAFFLPLTLFGRLASAVPEEACRRVNLGYLDYRTFDRATYEHDPDTLVVEDAGRDLYLVEPR